MIPGEVYYIQSRLNGKHVDVCHSGTDNGTNIHLWTLNKTNAQKFRVLKNNSYYSFLSLCDENKAIDGGGQDFNIHIWEYSNDNDNQMWELKLIEDEWYSLICKSNNHVMDVAFCHSHDGANIFCCGEHHFLANQQFRFINVNTQFFDSSILSNIAFSYTIRQAGCTYNNSHPKLAIDAATEGNGKIQLWDNVINASNQKWDFIGVGPDTYYIRNCSPNLKYPFICNINSNQVIYKLYDGKMDDEYKWKFIKQGRKLDKDLFIIQNIKTKNYLDSGPHSNHKCGGEIYTNDRCGVEQIFLLANSEEEFNNNANVNNNNTNINNNNNNNSNNIKNDSPILQMKFNIYAIRKSGCLFLACCYVGGLTTYDQCIQAYHWASKEGKIRGNDCYVNMDPNTLASQISKLFGTNFKNGCTFGRNSHHFWVEQNGKEIYNSAGIGWRGR
jgi:hypothetical protein